MTRLVLAVLCATAVVSAEQQAQSSAATAPREFRDIDSFYKSLPALAPTLLDESLALQLTAMPLSCLDRPHARPTARPYLWEGTYTPVEDYQKNRAFYGCFDWHSAVNSTWSLVKALKMFPSMSTAPLIRRVLDSHLGKSNIDGELAFFKEAGQFELPYGYAWTLKVQGELLSWEDADAERWAANLSPLVKFFSDRLVAYLKQLERPVRTGLHPNTALCLFLMYDYTETAKDEALRTAIVEHAKRLFSNDTNCQTRSEPGPTDFISPCVAEAAIMGRILDRPAFLAWFDKFLPALYSADFRPLTTPMDPSLLSKPAQLAAKSHMIGLAFMRAEELNRVAAALPRDDRRVDVLRRLSAMHADMGMKGMHVAGYMGSHFLGAFTMLYLLGVAP